MEEKERKEVATVPLAYHELCLDREKAEKRLVIIAWAVSLVAVVALFVFLWLQYDYIGYDSETTSLTQTGVYVLSDSKGNIIAADVTPAEIAEIFGELEMVDGGETDTDNPPSNSPIP